MSGSVCGAAHFRVDGMDDRKKTTQEDTVQEERVQEQIPQEQIVQEGTVQEDTVQEDTVQEGTTQMHVIARIYTDFPEKFGIPRQSGLVEQLTGYLVFEPQYRVKEACKGIEEYSHLWLIWGFSQTQRRSWSPLVRPPRLGGNTKAGVFATRSPFRPNPLALSCVRLEEVILDKRFGTVLKVSGIDMVNKSPVYDIKPYLSYCDSHPDAVCGFADRVLSHALHVVMPQEIASRLDDRSRQAIEGILSQDPRTAYVKEEGRIWGITYAGWNIRFRVSGDTLFVTQLCRENRE